MANEIDHIAKVIEAAADVVVADAITYVKAHPQYGPIVAALGERAIQALAQGL